MDVDNDGAGSSVVHAPSKLETLFAKSDELTVAFYANLPVEVKQVLKNADFYGDSYSGAIDTVTGFALVVSARTCFVWQHAQALKGIPTCYIFACPMENVCPYHALVPYGPSREPGLILLSVKGEIRFWDSIGIGLAGGEHYSSTLLDLVGSEYISNFIRADPQTYIATTSTGRLFRLTLTSSGGKNHLTPHVFSRPLPSLTLANFLPSLFSSPPTFQPDSGNVSAVALGEKTLAGGKEVWALVDTRVQKWSMSVEGWEEVVLDMEVAGLLRRGVRDIFEGVPGDDSELDLELVDIAVESSGNLVILVSYAGSEDDTSIAMDVGSHPRRIYALIRLSYLADVFKVDEVRSVPYQSTSSSGAPEHPRIQLIQDGALICVQFGDAVALCARDNEYQDRLELKSNSDRTLGVGVIEAESAVLVLTAATMMKAYVDMDRVAEFDPEMGRAGLIKSIMMQAILYGSHAENPLHFSFPPDVDEESLMLGAEQLSQAVLESHSEVVRPHHDLGTQLVGRKERLSWLIRFINDNAVLGKMSQSSRQRLATDAEKLYACHQLWICHNEFLDAGATHSVLNEAIFAYMNEVGEGHHDDIVRAFFRYRVGDIENLLPHVMAITRKSAYELGRSLSAALPETNRIVLTVLKASFDYRDYNLGVYGIELPMLKPWTSRNTVIEIVMGLFDTTTKLVESPSADSEAVRMSSEPNKQLPELAAVLFSCIHERLEWLGSAAAADETGTERERQELEEKFGQLRPEVLETLRTNGHASHAFVLAENYHDFRSLASLCHKGTTYPPEDNPNAHRIQSYIEKFKDEFTTELYRWYIEHGELRVMFAQEDVYSGYMDKFFAEHHHPAISWIHDLGRGKHGAASQTLLAESQGASDLQIKHVHGNFSSFHDDLDFVSVLEKLVQEFKAVGAPTRGKHSLDAQVENIAKAKASGLTRGGQAKTAFLQIFKNLVRDLLQGKALSIEGAVDVLTLKNNADTVEDYATALHLLARAQNIPDTRKQAAFRSVWRRIYIHDDWNTIRQTMNITDAQLNARFQGTALYATLRAILPKDYQPEGYELPPSQAVAIPLQLTMSSRWPGMPPEEMESLGKDYRSEGAQLEELDLEEDYQKVRELAMHDVMWAS
ncbi:hypothetical protein PILCRDRAFT_64451 [Piloderma croceum F 1598]|uniref:Nucleoporin Nup133/Nup155-like C-terminal domain-containing protein n=1 Tax=Piloderma croceum (strain F 1598) TaxID=765440 RepID=A0A0C3CBV1_PILCF|nr:hypothetical protein PILCRDRAFT_64451 [Piloderma croceum F 1598]